MVVLRDEPRAERPWRPKVRGLISGLHTASWEQLSGFDGASGLARIGLDRQISPISVVQTHPVLLPHPRELLTVRHPLPAAPSCALPSAAVVPPRPRGMGADCPLDNPYDNTQ